MSDEDEGEEWEMKLGVDVVHVTVSGPSKEGVEDMFDGAVGEAFDRYEEHVEDGGDLPR